MRKVLVLAVVLATPFYAKGLTWLARCSCDDDTPLARNGNQKVTAKNTDCDVCCGSGRSRGITADLSWPRRQRQAPEDNGDSNPTRSTDCCNGDCSAVVTLPASLPSSSTDVVSNGLAKRPAELFPKQQPIVDQIHKIWVRGPPPPAFALVG